MSKTEKRELIEQQRKIFEAEAQRVDRRTGSFSFLTWSFFLAPLIAVEAFLSSTFGSAAGEEEDAKAVQAGATSHVMNNDPATIDLFNAKAVDETTKEAATPLQAHANQAGGAELLAGPLEEAAKPNSEAAAATRSGGRDDDSQHQGAHDLIHGSSVNALADSQLPASSTPASAQANALAGTPSHDVAAAAAPVEAVVPPVLATATDTAGTMSHEVAAAAAPVEAVVQPVLATATDTVGTLNHDVAAAAAPAEAVVQPVLATATDTMGTLSHDVAAAAAPAEAVVQPVLATATATVGTLSHDAMTEPLTSTAAISNDLTSDVSHPDSTGASDVSHPADTLLALATATDAPIQLPVSPPTASAQPVPDIQPTVAADVIALQNAPPPPANALFNGNEYTQYGVTLSSDVAPSPQGASSSADAASAQHTSVSAVADVQHAPPPPDTVDPAHITDHHAIL